jgi:hypothetical protein
MEKVIFSLDPSIQPPFTAPKNIVRIHVRASGSAGTAEPHLSTRTLLCSPTDLPKKNKTVEHVNHQFNTV